MFRFQHLQEFTGPHAGLTLASGEGFFNCRISMSSKNGKSMNKTPEVHNTVKFLFFFVIMSTGKTHIYSIGNTKVFRGIICFVLLLDFEKVEI